MRLSVADMKIEGEDAISIKYVQSVEVLYIEEKVCS